MGDFLSCHKLTFHSRAVAFRLQLRRIGRGRDSCASDLPVDRSTPEHDHFARGIPWTSSRQREAGSKGRKEPRTEVDRIRCKRAGKRRVEKVSITICRAQMRRKHVEPASFQDDGKGLISGLSRATMKY